MVSVRVRAAAPLAALALLALAPVVAPVAAPAAAQGVEDFAPPEVALFDFAGTWTGESVVLGPDVPDAAIEGRDLNVVITPRGGGFHILWTAVVLRGDPDDPEVERREAVIEFERTDRDHVFRNVVSGNPLEGEVLSWARLHGRTLSVYRMRLNEQGGYEVAVYDRTLTDDGMDLHYQRFRDGAAVRTITGHLARMAP